ncbi:MAG: hypothetical protein JSV26_04900 [bacterium]|nr:MAG: hypothetical protein JSV26_04900 [bacterium]
MTAPITTLSDRDLELLSAFHGHLCPMVLVGARLGRVASTRLAGLAESLDPPFAFFRGGGCAVDGVQMTTGCTWGNSNLLLLRGKDLSLTLTREGSARAIVAAPLPQVLQDARQVKGAVMDSPFSAWIMEGSVEELFSVEPVTGPADLSRYPEE